MQPGVPKHQRLRVILDHLAAASPARTSLEAYKILAKVIDQVEDNFLGEHTYNPPRSLLDVSGIERMYVTNLESVHAVEEYTGVQILLSSRHVTFLSRYGAIEIQYKIPEDKWGEVVRFKERHESVLFQKPDAFGDGVWHEKNL